MRVAAGSLRVGLWVSFEGSVVDIRQIEEFNDGILRGKYEVKGTSACPAPRVRLMKTGQSVGCKVLGLGKESHFEVKMLPGEKPWFSRPTGPQSRLDNENLGSTPRGSHDAPQRHNDGAFH